MDMVWTFLASEEFKWFDEPSWWDQNWAMVAIIVAIIATAVWLTWLVIYLKRNTNG